MPVRFKAQERSNPQNREDKKYYAQAVRLRTIKRKEIEEEIVAKTALSKAEARGVLVTLSDIIRKELIGGNGVKLEGIGTFSVRLKSEGAASPEELTANHIESVIINYRADSELNQEVKNTRFEKTV
ncbi:HU family DNA-binding protein [Carboxylicivirga linearis]|uniref:HU family DNA-binding protein n=1 Tax=Carboxylicivirga linearis TaxID=1628157 RepID=A0ABS5K1N3_9BACT|nr:HU family DNA-binding protein [Carboxylicivirga linearis]MBS2101033.1 HU family DNA-binding protein [Carboxylicivirga linearis]